MVWAWKETSLRRIWLGFVGRQRFVIHSKHDSMQIVWHCHHPHLFERSLLACSLTACMFYRWMYEETWEPCLQIRFMSRVLISSIRTVLDWWCQIMFCAFSLLRRRSKRHLNWRDTKALVYYDSAYVRSCSLFFMCLALQLLLLPIMEILLLLNWPENWALPCLNVSSTCALGVFAGPWALWNCSRTSLVSIIFVHHQFCTNANVVHSWSAWTGCHQCFWWV